MFKHYIRLFRISVCIILRPCYQELKNKNFQKNFRLRARQISQQNMRNSENIGHAVLGTMR